MGTIDTKIVKTIVEALCEDGEDFKVLIVPDHRTPLCIRTHSSEPVPYILYDSRKEEEHTWCYNEKDAAQTGVYVAEGHTIIDKLLLD